MKLFAVALLAATPALAHEFWIEPSTFRPKEGDLLKVRLLVGDGFPGEPFTRNPARIVEFVAVGEGAATPVPGLTGRDPAGELRIGADLPRVIGYRGNHSKIELEAEKFEEYLKSVGLEKIIERRKERGDSKKPGREAYARCAKSMLGGPGGGYDKCLGFPLELICKSDPAASREVALQLQLDGAPVEGVLVRAFPKDRKSDPLPARTDKEGGVKFALPRAGMWMVSATHMREAAPALGADWESLWASVTFQSPEG